MYNIYLKSHVPTRESLTVQRCKSSPKSTRKINSNLMFLLIFSFLSSSRGEFLSFAAKHCLWWWSSRPRETCKKSMKPCPLSPDYWNPLSRYGKKKISPFRTGTVRTSFARQFLMPAGWHLDVIWIPVFIWIHLLVALRPSSLMPGSGEDGQFPRRCLGALFRICIYSFFF